jgi:hypothetical protein
MPILVEIPCPKCHFRISEKIKNISFGKTCQCPSCLFNFEFRTEHVAGVLRQAEKAFKPAAPDVERTTFRDRQNS